MDEVCNSCLPGLYFGKGTVSFPCALIGDVISIINKLSDMMICTTSYIPAQELVPERDH